jgi:hypothetical protein
MEWLNARFLKQGNNYSINCYVFQNNKYIQKAEFLQRCLMQDKNPGIDFEHYLKNATNQGLPKEDFKEGNFYYWYPRGEAVARFGAGSFHADLICFEDPSNLHGVRGVRRVLRLDGNN